MPTLERSKKITSIASARQQAVVVLEDIHDPHNAAAVFRSCEAFGVQDVYLIFKTEKKFNPRKIGSSTSSSANKWLDFHSFTSVETCLAAVKKRGYAALATMLDDQAEPLYTAQLNEAKIAWLFGNEHRGLSPEIVTLADRRIYIPMAGFVQSLNLSVTAGICLFEMTRQRRESGQQHQLSKKKAAALAAKWRKQ